MPQKIRVHEYVSLSYKSLIYINYLNLVATMSSVLANASLYFVLLSQNVTGCVIYNTTNLLLWKLENPILRGYLHFVGTFLLHNPMTEQQRVDKKVRDRIHNLKAFYNQH
jgi:hypothetical protein